MNQEENDQIWDIVINAYTEWYNESLNILVIQIDCLQGS